MTRINVSIDPRELPVKLLLAEHREMKRIPNCIKSGRFNLDKIPEKFCLGPGHVSFFYNKLGYLQERYRKVFQECVRRKYSIQDYSENFVGIPEYFMGSYQETSRDRELLLERFREKGFTLLEVSE